MRIFLTGASGFVGSTLCDELTKQGHEVRALMRKHSAVKNLTSAKYLPVSGDLRDADSLVDAVKDVDVIFHVAGVVAALDRASYFQSNEQGTKNLLEAVLKSGTKPKRFVYVSSLAAAGPSHDGHPRKEDEPNTPVSTYGESKLAGEEAVLAMKGKFPVVVVRPPAVYGPRDVGVFSFFQTVKSGFLPLLGLSNKVQRTYSFVHVSDLVQGILAAAFTPEVKSGSVYYVSGDGEYSWEQAMYCIAKGMNKKTIPLRLPIPFMYGVAAASTVYGKAFRKVMPLSLDKMNEIKAKAWVCSNEKAKKELGYKPYWDLDKGMAMTAKWYKENNWL